MNPEVSWSEHIPSLSLIVSAVVCGVSVVVLARVALPLAPWNTVQARSASLPTDAVSLSDAKLSGNMTARVGVLIFSDFQCPFCSKFATTLAPALFEKYVKSGQVVLAFRHYPLAMHDWARSAAVAAECANHQGSFWRMHDSLFSYRGGLSEQAIRDSQVRVGLDAAAFATCRSADTARMAVERDAAAGLALGVDATPTLFVGTMDRNTNMHARARVVGPKTLDELSGVIDEALRAVTETSHAR